MKQTDSTRRFAKFFSSASKPKLANAMALVALAASLFALLKTEPAEEPGTSRRLAGVSDRSVVSPDPVARDPEDAQRLALIESRIEGLLQRQADLSDEIVRLRQQSHAASVQGIADSNASIRSEQPGRATGHTGDIDVQIRASLPADNMNKAVEEQVSRQRQSFQRLTDLVQQQNTDPRWSAGASQEIMNVLRSGQFEGSTPISAECRESVCLVEVEHQSSTAQDRFFETFPVALGWMDSSTRIQVDELGTHLRSKLVITRSGYDLIEN